MRASGLARWAFRSLARNQRTVARRSRSSHKLLKVLVNHSPRSSARRWRSRFAAARKVLNDCPRARMGGALEWHVEVGNPDVAGWRTRHGNHHVRQWTL